MRKEGKKKSQGNQNNILEEVNNVRKIKRERKRTETKSKMFEVYIKLITEEG